MGAYYIKKKLKVSIEFPYNHNNFAFILSDYFIGPDLRFTVSLNGTSDNENTIIMPIISNPFDKTNITYNYVTKHNCTNNVFKRFTDTKSGEPMFSFACIQNNFIEHHIFQADGMVQVRRKDYSYENSKFIGYFKSNKTNKYKAYSEVIMVLSEETRTKGCQYVIHVFYVEEEYIVWVDKFSVYTFGYKLREKSATFNLQNFPFIALIDESSRNVIFTSDDASKMID